MVESYHPIIFKVCSIYAESANFDDLYQEILINLWKSMGSFEGKSKISTWLYRVALNTAMTYRRKTSREGTSVSLSSVGATLPAPDCAASAKEARNKWLYSAIAKLGKEDRSLVLLYLEEKSYKEIAEITGLSPSNVGVRVNRVKKKLQEILENTPHG
jgi:RNA polymerase sigma-70 factor (ECF subfamily)